ncbi:DNA phosphorothioation-dependent restriction protein DptF [Neptunomonas japonica]|uniref:DNA phosphorothioation-dependent restriction protein DptF n=1 Tax=Neptunomonas japonica JAMM 1380 TaxID=1441457 RepID=A0A7R6SXG4_9GAMM|nr:DNA phosphorothioation-dependent restriction protein DptF [Neptunomonas japonica]BBB31486.1 DNA phosphorothioation-dependent restriction protein DptF [Neptunomonas japonica JAMM 1380]
MDLRKALAVLSKSSPNAVTTAGEIIDPELRAIKNYLYVETEIEVVFKQELNDIQENDVIFLCGSSGDGKSEILTRYSEKHEKLVDFHLDATHSFDPSHTAIDTLNDRFTKQKTSRRPLVIGINIGMLANFEREGADEHCTVKAAIKQFLNTQESSDRFTFLDFEAFPKFKIEGTEVSSAFFNALLDRVVRDDQGNKFRDCFNQALALNQDKKLIANVLLLRDRSVQKVVVELLLNARIRQDQFVTARMLLDFIYCILTGSGYLFDNLFKGGDNELLKAMVAFDPSVIRNRDIDRFILNRTLDIEDTEYQLFIDEIEAKYSVIGTLQASSAIRLFYLLKQTGIEHNYHKKFKSSFHEKGELLYREIWALHRNYAGDKEDKIKLRRFYDDVVFAAIELYANRNAPYLSKDEFYLSSHGSCDLASEIELSVNHEAIEGAACKDIHAFYLHFSVNDKKLEPLPVNVNLLTLMLDVVEGYRPNKHDKNSVVLLDELVSHITSLVSNTEVLYLYRDGQRVKVKAHTDGDIRVSGL